MEYLESFFKKNNLKIESGPGRKEMGYVVRGLIGNPKRIELRDYIFDHLPDKLKKLGAHKGYGGKGRSSIAPNIYFDNGVKIVFAPTEGEKTVRATDYEKAIVSEWNQRLLIKEEIIDYPIEIEESVKRIVDVLQKKIYPYEKALLFGSNKSLPVSEFWKKYNPKSDNTPKTDIIIGNKRISLKVGSSAQISSAKVIRRGGEALINLAIEKSKLDTKLSKELLSYLEINDEGFSKLGFNSKEIKKRGRKFFRSNHKKFTDLLNKAIKENKQFGFVLLKEMLTGYYKFGQHSEATANYLLVVSQDGKKVKFNKITNQFVNKILDKFHVYCSFKTSGSTTYAALRAQIL